MKKKIKFCFVAMGLVTTFSCSRYIAPPFTDVVKISQIKPSMKVKQVIDVLGIDPYDIYYMQETGAQMLSFNYRLKNRVMYPYHTVNHIKVKKQTSNEDSQKAEDIYYEKKHRTVYVLFSKDGELVSYLTTSGASDKGELVVTGNSIQYYDEKNINSLDSNYNKEHNPNYNAQPINIGVNKDGTFGQGASQKNKWYDLRLAK